MQSENSSELGHLICWTCTRSVIILCPSILCCRWFCFFISVKDYDSLSHSTAHILYFKHFLLAGKNDLDQMGHLWIQLSIELFLSCCHCKAGKLSDGFTKTLDLWVNGEVSMPMTVFLWECLCICTLVSACCVLMVIWMHVFMKMK